MNTATTDTPRMFRVKQTKPLRLEWTYEERPAAWIGRAGRKRIGCVQIIAVRPATPYHLTFFQKWAWFTPGHYEFATMKEAQDKCQELYNQYHDYKPVNKSR